MMTKTMQTCARCTLTVERGAIQGNKTRYQIVYQTVTHEDGKRTALVCPHCLATREHREGWAGQVKWSSPKK